MRRDWFAPLTGVLFVALLIVGIIVSGEPPDVEDPVQEIVDHYTDNGDSTVLGIIIGGIGVVLFVLFANHLRRLFSAAGEAPLAATVLVGASIMAVGFAIDATLLLALVESVDDIEPASVQALQALWDNDFIPIALGTLIFLLSAGVSILQTGALPRWLGWIALVLVVLGPTPLGFVSFLGGGIWVVVVSVLLTVRSRREPAAPAPPPSAVA